MYALDVSKQFLSILESIRIVRAIFCVIIIRYDNVPFSLSHSLNQSMNPYSHPISYVYPNLLTFLTNPSLSILSKTLLAQLSIMLTHLSLYYQNVLLLTDCSEYVFSNSARCSKDGSLVCHNYHIDSPCLIFILLGSL